MAVEAFLNPAHEVNVIGELTDEEIIGMINHAEAEAEGSGRSTCELGEGGSMPSEPGSEEIVLSTSEALKSIESLIHKLLIDTDIPEAGLKAIGALRELEKVLRIQKLREFTVQQSILSYFTLAEN